MKNKFVRTLSAFLSVLMLISCFCIFNFTVSAATYRNGAQSGPSASYAGSRYYRNYQRVPITGDNRSDLIAIALSQLGYQEGAANGYFSGEISGGANYVEMSYNMGDLGLGYGGSDYPWCASFVSWCLYQSRCTDHATYSSLARNHSGDYRYIWKEISCAMWVNQLKGAGYFSYSAGMGGSYTPQYGDLVFFKSSSSPSHIGICLYVKNGVLYTVEGNTSDASGLETNGGGVYFKSYSLSSSYLYGYGRLPYASNSSVNKVDYSGANPTPGLYIANAAKYIYSSETTTSAFTTIPRFSMFEITKVGSNNRLFGTFTDVNGSTVTGWVENNSSRIIQLYSSGALSGSWEYDGTGYKYKWSDGSYASQGWLQDPENQAWYYIGANGYAQSGWLYLSTGTFYLDPNSNAMLTGHRFIDGRWYYFNNDGYLCDGSWEYDGLGYRYRYVDGTYAANCWLDDAQNNYVRYYIDANGYSVRGWQKIGDAWYYFDPNSGAMLSGWLFIGDKWYYTDSNGAMQTGWVEEDGHYFYFDSSGARVENTTVDINGSTCTFDKNGVLVEGSVIEDTQTPNVGGGYSSYTGGMPSDGTGVVQAHGIDISKWNNGDDWTTLKLNLAAVKAAGIDFVIMRCGSTNKGEDPMFDMYYNECKRLGLDVGAYFYSYALDAASAVSDAQKCLSYIEGKQFEYPIYMDFEDPTQEGIGGTLSAQICKAFLDTVSSGGYLTGMYTYKSWFEQGWVDSSGISSKYEGWVTYPIKSQNHANYDLEFSKKYGMYQYTFEYVIANAGTFDANVCYKDYPTIVKTYGFNNYTATATPNLSASWVQDDYGFRYRYSDGTYAGAGWLLDSSNNAWYYLDANGYAVSGWVEDAGKTYYLDPNSNAMLTGHRYIDGHWYYFDSSGALVTNGMWYQDENGFKYQMGDGTFVYSGWIDEPISGARYYLDANGYAVSGFQTIDGTLYYFFPDSKALFRGGWLTLADGSVYRTAADGAILKGFQYVDGEYFYFDESTGAMQTGFVTFGNKWYYFSTEDGTMVTGWFTSPKTGYEYYFNDEGEMTIGWAELDGSWYFFEDDMDKHYGQMLTGWVTSSTSGYTYYLGEDGKMLTGWQEIGGNTYYLHPTDETYLGRMVTGVNDIDGVSYVFDSNGVLLGQLATPEVDYFTVIYLNADGNYLGNEKVESGKPAANIPENPTMKSDAQYTYTFTGWDKDLTSITEDTVVTAVYEATVNTYTVTFKDKEGNTIDTQTVEYGTAAAAPEAPAVDDYTFTGWDKDFSVVTENLTITAVYEHTAQIYYLRGEFNSWQTTDAMTKGENGIYTAVFTLDAGTYEYKAANADYSMEWPLGTNQSITLKEKSIVTFTLDTINHTLTAKAESAETKYSVVFVDFNGDVISSQYVVEGASAEAPATPEREGYTFTGWSESFDNVTSDMILIAQYEKAEAPRTYSVTFIDDSGKFIATQQVAYGEAAKAPEIPEREGYTFIKWDKDFSAIEADTIVTAIYEKNTVYYTVTFLDKDGAVLDTQTVEYGAAATAPEAPAVDGYTFTGWDTDFAEVTGDITVKATYKKNATPVAPATTGKLQIEVSGGTGFTIAIGEGGA
ncbi:MAG: InlB B-repeat-containing protein, partial [Ruminococcus sp.]|nr:InlB B-repeat-containing protein [Ruminococcus sp.]